MTFAQLALYANVPAKDVDLTHHSPNFRHHPLTHGFVKPYGPM
jgi:hypothetical protein